MHELAAGKLTALLDRKTGRDLFDTYHLLKQTTLNMDQLRKALVVYSAISQRVDLRKLTPEDISVDIKDLNNRLLPLLRKNDLNEMRNVENWTSSLLDDCQRSFHQLLPLKKNEMTFLDNVFDRGIVEPELITTDIGLMDNIRNHPAIRRSMQR